ncbi:MAG: substrate-binding domain-containing protein [Ruminococcus sp.]|nr:substrate-binding domain-containing protein [Ruminococcus sp.]
MKRKVIAIALAAMTLISCAVMQSCQKSGFDAGKNISVVAREDGSGTKSAFMEIIGLKGKSDVSGVIIATGTAGVLAEVKSNPLAIAYESLGYVTDDVKKLKIDGVEATVENIKNGTYKIARPLRVVYKPATVENSVNAAYLKFLQSDAAQKIVSAEGYVALVDNAQAYYPDSSLSGTINISGSTSLQPLMIKLAAKFQELQSGVSVTVAGGGSGQGYKNAEAGVSEFGMISESFNSEKAPDCVSYEVAKDGIAVIVNKDNTQDSISLINLKNIYDAEAGENAVITWSKAQG